MDHTINSRMVRRMNRKQVLLRLEDKLLPWAIASVYVVMVGFMAWMNNQGV